MTRIVHLSDLHFGTQTAALCAALTRAVTDIAPDLVVVSGDLTQRARPGQFAAAHAFLQGLGRPYLVVPGNHDIPLYNLFLRLFRPWHRFRRWFGLDLSPVWQNAQVIVAGFNSSDPMRHQKGVFHAAALAALEPRLQGTQAFRIVVTHHPPAHAAGADKALPRFGAEAVRRLAQAKTDVILSGHLHKWYASPLPVVKGVRGMLQVQAGTALSSRLRGEPNDFNLITLTGDTIGVTRYAADDAPAFAAVAQMQYRLAGEDWVAVCSETDAVV
jgi:3',5'-cyclic AMP phosphodiesterase CpdA